MKTIPKMLVFGLLELVIFGAILFLSAGTFNYWQAWVFLVVFAVSTWIPAIYLLRTNSVALQRRMHAGPTAETRTVQKVFILGWYFSLAAIFVASALDHRFGWSSVPTPICLVGLVLVAVGLSVMMLVVIQNNYAAATVRVEPGQNGHLNRSVRSGAPPHVHRQCDHDGRHPRRARLLLGPGLRHAWPDRPGLAYPRRGKAAQGRAWRIPRVHAKGSLSPRARHVVTAAQPTPEPGDFTESPEAIVIDRDVDISDAW